MAYTLSIGELYSYTEDGLDFNDVKTIKHDAAPEDDSPTDHTNQRWPSYGAWNDFMIAGRINHNLMIQTHPGYVRIDKKFKIMVDRAYDLLKDNELHKGRAEWLKYWTDWAIENCKNPVFCNS